MDCRTQLASLAIEELDKGDFLMATKILTTGIRLEPNNHELYLERSICHYKLGDYQASLDDANAAIRLKSSDHNVHYQKGLALIGLSMLPEAMISFKKAVELKAQQEDSKLSDIYKLLVHAIKEMGSARGKPVQNFQNQSETVMMQNGNQTDTAVLTARQGTGSDPVDSTTDRHQLKPGPSSHLQGPGVTMDTNNESGNLVAKYCNNQPISSQLLKGVDSVISGVSSSANYTKESHKPSPNMTQNISNATVGSLSLGANFTQNNQSSNLHIDHSKVNQFEWNIRRSERIFLHSNESGQPGTHYAILPSTNAGHAPRSKTNSNPSSIISARGASKRAHDESETQTYHPTKMARSKDGTDSHVGSDVDVDDSCSRKNTLPQVVGPLESSSNSDNTKRVMIAPSSSMPATAGNPQASTSRDDSYSSKWKRLRRDRERARRGTSKLCTIKLSDLDELQKPINFDREKKFMRVIAPIDGWLYSGQLSVDDNTGSDGPSQYVVKLDGDATGGSYLFSQETVLNDVIKEVRVKTVSELRKGARICCYWSRQYKCLSTGVVTSRTFEATKSLVSVKYDNGDLSALPLDDLRLLPPDYPKYMSNCDPLLLARSGDGAHVSVTLSPAGITEASQSVSERQTRILDTPLVQNASQPLDHEASRLVEITSGPTDHIQSGYNSVENSVPSEIKLSEERDYDSQGHDEKEEDLSQRSIAESEDDAATIPPTDEIIDFITNDSALKLQETNHEDTNLVERPKVTKDNITLTPATQIDGNDSRASSEENNYGIEYRPWVFEGPPKKSKRYGRTYRDNYTKIRRGSEIIEVGDSAELMPRDESILPFIARIEGFWATSRGEMRVKVRWYYRLDETEGEPYELKDGQNALFETQHMDENDVQSIYRSTRILPWTEYSKNHSGHINENNVHAPKVFYLAGYYDPVRRSKHLRSDVKESQ